MADPSAIWSENVLFALMEVSVAFVGFSALVVAFRNSRRNELDAVVVMELISTGFCALFFSVLPLVFRAFQVETGTAWRVGSALQCVVHTLLAANYALAIRRHGVPFGLSRIAMGAAGGLVIFVLALNALAVGFSGEFGPYLLGVVWTLAVSAFHLGGIVMRRDSS